MADDDFNNESNTVIGDDDCDVITEGYDEHATDSYSNVVCDYGYDVVNGIDGKYEIDSFFYSIGTYEDDVASEADDDTGESRCDILESHGDLPRGAAPVGVHRIE